MPSNEFVVHVILHEREETKVCFTPTDNNQTVTFRNIKDSMQHDVSRGLGILKHVINGANDSVAAPCDSLTNVSIALQANDNFYIRIYAAAYREFDIVFSNCTKLKRFYAPRHSYWDLSILEPCTNLQGVDINGHVTGSTVSLRDLMYLRSVQVHVTEGITFNLLHLFQNSLGVAKTEIRELHVVYDSSYHAKNTSLVFDTNTIHSIDHASTYTNIQAIEIRGVSSTEPFWGITGIKSDLRFNNVEPSIQNTDIDLNN